jgi:hypothetical protein
MTMLRVLRLATLAFLCLTTSIACSIGSAAQPNAMTISRQQMIKHPAVILHELAHGYHDQVLGFGEPRIKAAYDKAMEARIYDKVLLYTGREVEHYAASNHKEYFAEGTEAYFYRNDFYPFVAAELRQHDPRLYELLEQIWGKLK